MTNDLQRHFDDARNFFSFVDGEPKLLPDRVLLRELVHIVETLAECPERDAAETVLSFLRDGSLYARSWETESIIPHRSWPISEERFDGVETYPSVSWRMSTVRNDTDCKGHVGDLPYIARHEALHCLPTLVDSAQKQMRYPPPPSKRPENQEQCLAELRRAVRWWQERGIQPKSEERLDWARANVVQQRETARKYLNEVLPSVWKRPGVRSTRV